MAEPAIDAEELPPAAQAALRRANRVIANLGADVGDLAQQLAVVRAALAEEQETSAALREALVAATGGGDGETAPSATPASTGR